jgi:Uma2 family endonuclease
MNWLQVCEDRTLTDLPYKIELDKHGKLVLSPAGKQRSKLKGRIQGLLSQLLHHGDPLVGCAVETIEGTKVPDVAWISGARWTSMNPDEVSCSVAPEICIEILSRANTVAEMLGTAEKPGKRELYFQAGAIEFWICDEAGQMFFHNRSGQISKSELCPSFPDRV